MKSVLITGANSYVGTNVAKWLSKYPDNYLIKLLSVRDESWMSQDFSVYDVVLHVAGIAHIKENKENTSLYYRVNRDLTYNVAVKAKESGVKQFIFISTMAVYGELGSLKRKVIINKNTKPRPLTNYAKSKYEGEQLLDKLGGEGFKVAIVRPPIIYGTNCPGNYSKLDKIASFTFIFPEIENQRSMIHVDNLCIFIKEYIDREYDGLFLPQNKQYINTSKLVERLAADRGREIYLSQGLGWIIKKIFPRNSMVKKIFGNLVYEIDNNEVLE